jgi:hypothetical protein
MSRPTDDTPTPGRPDALLQRYAEANALDAARPGKALRDAVLAHARQQVAGPGAPLETQAPAANDGQWKWRALGSLAVVGLVGLLVMQFERDTSDEQAVALGTANPRRNPATLPKPADAPPPPAASGAGAPAVQNASKERQTANAPALDAELASPPPSEVARRASPAAKAAVPETPGAPAVAERMAPMQRPAPADTVPAPPSAPQAETAADMDAAPNMAPAEPPAAMAAAPSAARERPAALESRQTAPKDKASQATSETMPAAAPRAPQPPLHSAVAAGQPDLVRALLAQGANINARDARGRTPLMIAASGDSRAVVVALLAAGADTSLRDPAGLNASDLAARAGHADWLPLFLPTQR